MKYLLLCLACCLAENAFAVRRGSPSTRKEVVEIEEFTPNVMLVHGSGVVIDPHVIVTTGRIIPACDKNKIKVFLDNGKWIQPDEIDCPPNTRVQGAGFASAGILLAIEYSRDIAFLIFKKPLPLPVAEPAWNDEDISGTDIVIAGYGPRRSRAEGRAKLAHFQKSEAIELMLNEVKQIKDRDLGPVLSSSFLEVVSDPGVGVMMEPSDVGGAMIHVDTGKLVGINVFTVAAKNVKKDYGGAIHVNSPIFRERMRMAHYKFPWAFQNADPILKKDSERAKIERQLFRLTEQMVTTVLEWYLKDLNTLNR